MDTNPLQPDIEASLGSEQGRTRRQHARSRLLGVEDHGNHLIASGDASACYPGLLRRFIRTLVLFETDVLIVRDVIVNQQPPAKQAV
jgi:hypothetical protein